VVTVIYKGGIKLQFRVEIPRQKGYAYAAQVGSPVTKDRSLRSWIHGTNILWVRRSA